MIVIFSGTTEGRQLSHTLAAEGIAATVCSRPLPAKENEQHSSNRKQIFYGPYVLSEHLYAFRLGVRVVQNEKSAPVQKRVARPVATPF